MNNHIDPEKCSRCGLCIEVCPVSNFKKTENGEVIYITERTDICQECGQCMAVCPEEAVYVAGYDYEKDLFPLPEHPVDYTKYMDFLAGRRSVRNFRDRPVPEEVIEQILEPVYYAPYGAAPEKTRIIVINDRAVIEKALPLVVKFLDDIGKWMENPIARFMMRRGAGPETFSTVKNHIYPMVRKGNYDLQYGDQITRGAPVLIFFHGHRTAEEHTNNALIQATYAMLAVHAMGLGATMNELVPAAVNRVPELKKIFSIPEEDDVVISLMLGYPKYKYQKAIKRRKTKVRWISSMLEA